MFNLAFCWCYWQLSDKNISTMCAFYFQSGKSTFIRKLINWKGLLFNPNPQKVIYVYAAQSPFIEQMIQQGKIHKAIKRLPKNFEDLENMLTPNISTGTLLIIDDALGELATGNYLPEVFEELTHRTNTALVFVSQATFLNSPTFRRLSGTFITKLEKICSCIILKLFTDNAHYIVCLRNKRNALKIRALATQTRPCNASFVLNAYVDATKPKQTVKNDDDNSDYGFGYLIFDFVVTGKNIFIQSIFFIFIYLNTYLFYSSRNPIIPQ